MLPRIIHFVWIGNDPPPWIHANINRFRELNRDWRVVIHGESALDERYSKYYTLCRNPQMKSDLLRLSVIRKFGGFYFDTDFWPLRPLSQVIGEYTLDRLDDKMFLPGHPPQKNKNLFVGNAVIAAEPYCKAWDVIDEYLSGVAEQEDGLMFGPRMFTELSIKYPDRFIISDPRKFFPLDKADSAKEYVHIRKTLKPSATVMSLGAHALHVWAGGSVDPFGIDGDGSTEAMPDKYKPLDMTVGLVADNSQWNSGLGIWRSIWNGLQVAAKTVTVSAPGVWPIFSAMPQGIVVWNGLKPPINIIVEKSRDKKAGVLICEHGFFDRFRFTQVDRQGFGHWASWAHQTTKPAPVGSGQRLRDVLPWRINFRKKRGSYVLVLGQMHGDTQMSESETCDSMELLDAVLKSAKQSDDIRYRSHPLSETARPMCELDGALDDAIDGAKYVVCINSNAGNESIARGKPVLCLGPALYSMGGVAKQTTLSGLSQSMDDMRNGWEPEREAAENYLRWLASRQWSNDELAKGVALRELMSEAIEAAKDGAA